MSGGEKIFARYSVARQKVGLIGVTCRGYRVFGGEAFKNVRLQYFE
jgi:hypothetical protein